MKEPQGKNTHVIYGLEAFNFERPWVAWRSESMLKPVNLNTWFNDIQTDMRTQLTTLKLIAHAIWQSVAVMLVLYFFETRILSHFPATRSQATVLLQSLLLLGVYALETLVVLISTIRVLTLRLECKCLDWGRYGTISCDRGTDRRMLSSQGPPLLSYIIASLICHNIWWICRVMLLPFLIAMLLLILQSLGLLSRIVKSLKSRAWDYYLQLLSAYDTICFSLAKTRRRFYVAYRRYVERHEEQPPSSQYVYERISSSEIRLIRLRRAHPLANATFYVIRSPIDGAPRYQALSYTWGNPKRTHSICVDGQRLEITKNAHEALHDLVPFWGSKLIWIDSICINQDDPVEKGEQVGHMDQIYRDAVQVVGWLGNAVDADLAISQLYKLHRLWSEPTVFERVVLQEMQHELHDEDNLSNWRAFSTLLRHPYWSRIWIIQELAVSKSVCLVYGHYNIPWKFFYNVIARLATKPGNNTLVKEASSLGIVDWKAALTLLNIRAYAGFRHEMQEGNYNDLWVGIWSTGKFDATDCRDRIYALKALTSHSAGTSLAPNYTISPQELFTRFARHYLTRRFPAVIHAAGIEQQRNLPSLPSWVPDLSSKWEGYRMLGGPAYIQDHYRASNGLDAEVSAIPNSQKIRTKGTFIDKIERMTTRAYQITPVPSQQLFSKEVRDWHDEAYSLVSQNYSGHYDLSVLSIQQIFVRAIIGDRSADGTKAPVDYADYYDEWLEYLSMECNRKMNSEDFQSEESEPSHGASLYSKAVYLAVWFRRFAITKKGLMALVPEKAEVGDDICIFPGMDVPSVVRPAQHEGISSGREEHSYVLVGNSYVEGVMTGVAMGWGLPVESIVLQ